MSRSAKVPKRSQWLDRMRRFAGSQLTVTEFCRREQVSVASFYQWRQKLSDSSPDLLGRPAAHASFIPVQVTTTTDLQVTFPNGVRLTLPTQDRELIRMSIEAIAHARTSQGDA